MKSKLQDFNCGYLLARSISTTTATQPTRLQDLERCSGF